MPGLSPGDAPPDPAAGPVGRTISWKRVITLDARSLAVGRIAIALLIIVDLAFRASDLEAHYSDLGVMPRSALHYESWDFLWSLHAISGSPAFEWALFSAAFVAALLMLLGLFTQWSIAVSWLLACSLHARNPLIRDGQDDFLRLVLFFAMFLPLGRFFSIDAKRSMAKRECAERARGEHAGRGPAPNPTPAPTEVASVATVAFIFQLLLVYWTSGMTKLESPVWASGGGVHYALSLSRYQTAIGKALLEHPSLTTIAGYATESIELIFPFFVLVPRWTDRFRLVAIFAFVMMHLSFLLSMHLGIFPCLCWAAWAMMVPSSVWARFSRPAPEANAARASSWSSILGASLAALGAFCALVANLATISPAMKVPKPIGVLAVALGVQQFWGVFAPNPVTALSMNDGWFVLPGTLERGEEIDAFSGRDRVSYEKPRFLADTVKNHRWRHYFANVRVSYPPDSDLFDTVEKSRGALLDYLCRRWNDAHDAEHQMVKVKLVYMNQRIGDEDAPIMPQALAERPCTHEASIF